MDPSGLLELVPMALAFLPLHQLRHYLLWLESPGFFRCFLLRLHGFVSPVRLFVFLALSDWPLGGLRVRPPVLVAR